MVLVLDITFTSMCENHLLPFDGVAHVANIPNTSVSLVGNSLPSSNSVVVI